MASAVGGIGVPIVTNLSLIPNISYLASMKDTGFGHCFIDCTYCRRRYLLNITCTSRAVPRPGSIYVLVKLFIDIHQQHPVQHRR